MHTTIAHLFEHPEHIGTVAQWIYREWWTDKPGVSAETMEQRLREASDAESIPLSLLALVEGRPAGTVNLVENDDEHRRHLAPWLAALLVLPDYRGRGIGSQLVRALVAEAERLGVTAMYLGTDIPAFYERLGARVYEQISDEYCVMRLGT